MRKRLRSRVGMRLPTPAKAVPPPPSANRLPLRCPPTAFAPLSANRLRAKFSDSFRRRRELRPAVMRSMRAKPNSFSSHYSPSRTSGASWPTGHRGQPGGRSNRAPRPTGRAEQPGTEANRAGGATVVANRAGGATGRRGRSGVVADRVCGAFGRRGRRNRASLGPPNRIAGQTHPSPAPPMRFALGRSMSGACRFPT